MHYDDGGDNNGGSDGEHDPKALWEEQELQQGVQQGVEPAAETLLDADGAPDTTMRARGLHGEYVRQRSHGGSLLPVDEISALNQRLKSMRGGGGGGQAAAGAADDDGGDGGGVNADPDRDFDVEVDMDVDVPARRGSVASVTSSVYISDREDEDEDDGALVVGVAAQLVPEEKLFYEAKLTEGFLDVALLASGAIASVGADVDADADADADAVAVAAAVAAAGVGAGAGAAVANGGRRCGFLNKLSDHLHRWNKRFVVLREHVLFYTKEEMPASEVVRRPRGVIFLRGCAVRPQPMRNAPWAFEIVHPTERAHTLSAESEESMSGWIASLNEAINPGTSSSTSASTSTSTSSRLSRPSSSASASSASTASSAAASPRAPSVDLKRIYDQIAHFKAELGGAVSARQIQAEKLAQAKANKRILKREVKSLLQQRTMSKRAIEQATRDVKAVKRLDSVTRTQRLHFLQAVTNMHSRLSTTTPESNAARVNLDTQQMIGISNQQLQELALRSHVLYDSMTEEQRRYHKHLSSAHARSQSDSRSRSHSRVASLADVDGLASIMSNDSDGDDDVDGDGEQNSDEGVDLDLLDTHSHTDAVHEDIADMVAVDHMEDIRSLVDEMFHEEVDLRRRANMTFLVIHKLIEEKRKAMAEMTGIDINTRTRRVSNQ